MYFWMGKFSGDSKRAARDVSEIARLNGNIGDMVFFAQEAGDSETESICKAIRASKEQAEFG